MESTASRQEVADAKQFVRPPRAKKSGNYIFGDIHFDPIREGFRSKPVAKSGITAAARLTEGAANALHRARADFE
jgi:hypothetical protein